MLDIGTVRGWITILTFLVFLGICWWAFRPANRRRFRDDARIPFEGSDPELSEPRERDSSRAGDESDEPMRTDEAEGRR